MSLGKPQILPKIKKFSKIIKNQQMLCFCDNPIDRSLVLILKYIFCEFYTCTIVFKKLGWFESKQFSKNIFAISDINLF